MSSYDLSLINFNIYLMFYFQELYTISLLFLITVNPVISLSGCTVTIINIKSRDLQVFCDSEHSKLTEIPKDLKSYTRILSFSMQNITRLNAYEFRNVYELRNLIIKSSQLRYIDSLAFKDLRNLELLNLRNNSLQLISSSLPKDCFKYLTSLKVLDLSQNPIAFIPDLYFQYLGLTLSSLFLSDLSKNLSLSINSLYGLKELHYLDLTFNKFRTIHRPSLGNIIERPNFNVTTILLAGNLWNCDCRLRWIREWYFDNMNRINVNLVEELQPGLRNTFRPFCHSPLRLRGTYLFPSRSSTSSIQEMKCIEGALKNSSHETVQENGNITLPCSFTVDNIENYMNRVIWTHNGEVITKKLHLHSILKTSVDNFKLFSLLTLINVKTSYQGTWQCKLTLTEDLKGIYIDYQLSVKLDESNKLSNRSKKLLIYISISLLIFLLIVCGIGIIFYFCFKCHRKHSERKVKRKNNTRIHNKEIRPKSMENQQNHFLLYDDCDIQGRKMLKHYKPYNFSCDIQCGCKECQSINLDSLDNDSKSISPCPVHGICNMPLKEIVPNEDIKNLCPVHGGSSSEQHVKESNNIQSESLPVKSMKKSVTLKDIPNDIVLSTLGINKRVHLNCPIHGDVLSLHR